MRKSVVFLTCCLAAAQLHAQPELRGTPDQLAQLLTNVPRMVSIIGEAEIKVQADRATLTLRVGTDNKSLQEALKLNQEMRDKLTDYLKQQGIPSDRIRAANFSSTPKFGMFSDKAKSYHIDNFIKITLHDEKEFQAASGAVDKWSGVEFLGLDFQTGKKDELKKQVLEKACDNAGEKRKLFEDKLGIRLVPKRVSEGYAFQSIQNNGNQQAIGSVISVPFAQMAAMAGRPADASAGGEDEMLQFGSLTFRTQVTVEYSVESK